MRTPHWARLRVYHIERSIDILSAGGQYARTHIGHEYCQPEDAVNLAMHISSIQARLKASLLVKINI